MKNDQQFSGWREQGGCSRKRKPVCKIREVCPSEACLGVTAAEQRGSREENGESLGGHIRRAFLETSAPC